MLLGPHVQMICGQVSNKQLILYSSMETGLKGKVPFRATLFLLVMVAQVDVAYACYGA